jgi:hypothetical protein
MGMILFVKDLGRRLGVGNTPPAQSAQTPGRRGIVSPGKEGHAPAGDLTGVRRRSPPAAWLMDVGRGAVPARGPRR